MQSFSPPVSHPANRRLYDRLKGERALFDLETSAEIATLRKDVARIARGMDDPEAPPPMLWSGIPLPRGRASESCEWCLTISVGGTNTQFILIRLEDGEVVGLDRDGTRVRGRELSELRERLKMRTPTCGDTESGIEMIRKIVGQISDYIGPHRAVIESCQYVLLSWGFAHSVVRTDEAVLGGLTAHTTLMTKDQAGFTEDLTGKDVGELFAAEFESSIGWRRPVTVANDGVMALHYFLSKDHRERYSQIGLFINGTGCNFCLAEPYRVRADGIVSRDGETYAPERLMGDADGNDDDADPAVHYLVNYETGSIDMAGTRTRFDGDFEYPIESNALSGGNAFEQQFREFTIYARDREYYDRLVETASRGPLDCASLTGPEVARLAALSPAEIAEQFPGLEMSDEECEMISLIAQAVLARSALHVAMILAAVTKRRGFGLGDERGRSDLLGMEGSVWSAERYEHLVRDYWQALVEEPLQIEFRAERHYAASSRGPLFLTLLHENPVRPA